MERVGKSILTKNRFAVITAIVVIVSILLGFFLWRDYSLKKEDKPIIAMTNKFSDDPGVFQGYGVSSSNDLASQVGMSVLEKGGNAVDAAIAISYALGVVNPDTSGIGGGGGMLVYDPISDSYTFFNYESGGPAYSAHSTICIPGFVLGMETAWQKFGSIPMKELIQPAIDYAEKGFQVTNRYAGIYNNYAKTVRPHLTFSPNSQSLSGGEVLTQPLLAQTLEAIQKDGSSAFYSGEVADKICAQTGWSKKDLNDYRVDLTKPVQGNFAGYLITSAPPPFSGVTLIQMLKGFELTNIPNPALDESGYLSRLKQISDLSHADRIRRLADPYFHSTSYDEGTTTSYMQSLLSQSNIDYDNTEEEESACTTHITVADKNGMIVSCTNTLGNFFGAGVNVGGFYLNSSGSSFGSASGINSFQHGKKPRTFMSPTIIQGPDGFWMGIGSPGGNRIVKVLATVIWDCVIWKTDLQKAIDKNRIVFTGKNTMVLENSPYRENILTKFHSEYSTLKKDNNQYFGAIEAVGYSPERGGLFGGADPRRDSSLRIVKLAP